MDWRLQWGLLDQAPASTALSLQVHWPRKTMRNGILVFSLLKKICSPTWNLRSIYKHLNRLSLSPQLKSNPTKLCVIALELLLCSTESGPVEQGQVCHQQQVWGEERAWWSPDTGHMQAHWTYTNSPTDPCQATLPHVELYKLWEYDWVNLRLSSSTLHHCNEAWEVTTLAPDSGTPFTSQTFLGIHHDPQQSSHKWFCLSISSLEVNPAQSVIQLTSLVCLDRRERRTFLIVLYFPFYQFLWDDETFLKYFLPNKTLKLGTEKDKVF